MCYSAQIERDVMQAIFEDRARPYYEHRMAA